MLSCRPCSLSSLPLRLALLSSFRRLQYHTKMDTAPMLPHKADDPNKTRKRERTTSGVIGLQEEEDSESNSNTRRKIYQEGGKGNEKHIIPSQAEPEPVRAYPKRKSNKPIPPPADEHEAVDPEDMVFESEYYFENGLRKIRPYVFVYRAMAKQRWFGRKLVDIMTAEFRDRDPEYCKNAIIDGRVLVHGEKVSLDYVVVNGDSIHHAIHRHEPPVRHDPIEIVQQSKDLLVVNKPASIPVHPTGRFRYNTLQGILRHEMGYHMKLHCLSRLDRLTSGLTIICLTKARARQMEFDLRSRKVHKTYVARVAGRFPDGEIVCEQNIATVSPRLGICAALPEGKESRTIFRKIGGDDYSSILLCEPLTGRQHQIRVHLQYLGFPIVNDPLYNNVCWGPGKGKGGLTSAEVQVIVEKIEAILPILSEADSEDFEAALGLLSQFDEESIQQMKSTMPRPPPPAALSSSSPSSSSSSTTSASAEKIALESNSGAHEKASRASSIQNDNSLEIGPDEKRSLIESYFLDPDASSTTMHDLMRRVRASCPECVRGTGSDPIADRMQIDLCALKYSCEDLWSYEVPLPPWARSVLNAETHV